MRFAPQVLRRLRCLHDFARTGRGSDVVKALCLGARAVVIGRACLWGLAANGQAGQKHSTSAIVS